MSIEEFTQLYEDKATVTPRLNGAMYHIKAKDGYCILIPENIVKDDEGNIYKTYKYSVILRNYYDWSTIQITTIDSLEPGDNLADAGIPGPTA